MLPLLNKASSFVCLWLQFFFESMTRESGRVYRSYEHRTAHNLSQDFTNVNNARLTIVLIHLIQPCLQHICNRMSCMVSGPINFYEYYILILINWALSWRASTYDVKCCQKSLVEKISLDYSTENIEMSIANKYFGHIAKHKVQRLRLKSPKEATLGYGIFFNVSL